jgi:hypothetical protein
MPSTALRSTKRRVRVGLRGGELGGSDLVVVSKEFDGGLRSKGGSRMVRIDRLQVEIEGYTTNDS